MLARLDLASSKYYVWLKRRDSENCHNAKTPKNGWLLPDEKRAIIGFYDQNLSEGYRRLAYMMNDQGVVAASPSSVRRVLLEAGRIRTRDVHKSKKGNGFEQPIRPHQEWHTDISFIKIAGVFYSNCSFLDGFSRVVVHSELRETMTEQEVEIVLQRAREKYPGVKPKIISDNGPQFISKDFKAFISFCQMTHVRTSPYYPQSNGKIERWHRSMKSECIRPGVPLSLDHARRMMDTYVTYYNDVRLHSAIGYVSPRAKLEGRDEAIWAQRRQNLAEANRKRNLANQSEVNAENEVVESESLSVATAG